MRRVTRVAEAEHLLHVGAADAVVADAELVDEDTLARLRRECPAQPIVLWLREPASERAADLLEAGAHDVVHGGMSEREVAARVAAALRGGSAMDGEIVYGPLEIDGDTGEVRWDGAELRLTRRERQVLRVLASSPGRTVRRDRLYRQVWGYAMARGDRSVDVNVTRLRAKLAEAAGTRIGITTQPGVGYRLELEELAEPVASARAPVTPL